MTRSSAFARWCDGTRCGADCRSFPVSLAWRTPHGRQPARRDTASDTTGHGAHFLNRWRLMAHLMAHFTAAPGLPCRHTHHCRQLPAPRHRRHPDDLHPCAESGRQRHGIATGFTFASPVNGIERQRGKPPASPASYSPLFIATNYQPVLDRGEFEGYFGSCRPGRPSGGTRAGELVVSGWPAAFLP